MDALDADQVEHFLSRGHVVLPSCFSREVAAEWVGEAWVRLGYDPDDPSSWAEPRIHIPSLHHVDVAQFAPRAYEAACHLLGGEDRMVRPWLWGDSLIGNFTFGADQPWQPPSAAVGGWHKDGDFFRHFLDSPEQGLLVFVLWSDIHPRGGGTFIAADSVPVVARYLAERPEGVLPDAFDFAGMARRCTDFVEVTGRAGDVVLLHPYLLHAVSQNVLGIPRFISNPPVALVEPMQYDRENPADFSLVERAVLRGLGENRYAFRASAPRERVVPERVRHEEAARGAERERLRAAGLTP